MLLAAAAAPVFSTVLPPLVDYPNHLARMHLLAAGGSRYFAVQWAAIPNLAEDLIVPPLARLVPLDLAAKLFLVATFALLAGGTLWLNRIAAGGWRGWPLLAFLFLYTRTFLWGFLNYLFGLGLALCGAGLWLSLAGRPAWLRSAAATAVALACFFSHLAAWGIYCLLLLGVEGPAGFTEFRARRWPALAGRAAVLAPPLLVPAAVLLLLSPHPAGGGIAYAGLWRKADLLFSVFDDYRRPFDIACFALILGLFAALAAMRRLRLDPRLGSALGLLFLAYLLLPSRLFAGAGADHRLPAALFLLMVAASAPRFPSRRWGLAVGAAVALMLAARLAVVEQVWRAASRTYAADLAGLDALPQGTRLAVAFPDGAVNFAAVPELHLATLAAARREALVPTLFALPGQQPVALRPEYAAGGRDLPPALLWAAFVGGDAGARAAALQRLAAWDAVAFTDREPFRLPPDPCLTPVLRRPTFRIVAVRRGPGCAR